MTINAFGGGRCVLSFTEHLLWARLWTRSFTSMNFLGFLSILLGGLYYWYVTDGEASDSWRLNILT